MNLLEEKRGKRPRLSEKAKPIERLRLSDKTKNMEKPRLIEKGFTSQQQTKDQNNGTLVQTLMSKEGTKKFIVDQITDPSAVLALGVNSSPH